MCNLKVCSPVASSLRSSSGTSRSKLDLSIPASLSPRLQQVASYNGARRLLSEPSLKFNRYDHSGRQNNPAEHARNDPRREAGESGVDGGLSLARVAHA